MLRECALRLKKGEKIGWRSNGRPPKDRNTSSSSSPGNSPAMPSLFAQRVPFFIEIRCAADEGRKYFTNTDTVTLNTYSSCDSIQCCFFPNCRNSYAADAVGIKELRVKERERERFALTTSRVSQEFRLRLSRERDIKARKSD